MKFAPVALVLLCACIDPDPNEDGAADEDAVSQVVQYLKPNCDDIGCGSNSPHLTNRGFHFLYADGTANPQGYSIGSFEKNGYTYHFSVLNGEIRATVQFGNLAPIVVYSGAQVVGMRLVIHLRGVPRHVITIAGYDRIKSWATMPNGDQFDVPVYVFEWVDDFGIRQNLCSHPENAGETLGMNEYFTLLFEGDVINATRKTVSAGLNNNVVNFACAGNALAKLHLSGYTEVAKRLGFSTLPTERQAMLKMFTGDYCGDGTAYTVGGQPLYFTESKHWDMPIGAGPREAQWTPQGASCLGMPRMLANPSSDTAYYWPEITQRSDIPCASSLLACPNGTNWLSPDVPNIALSVNP
jgi:hypothetical protein